MISERQQKGQSYICFLYLAGTEVPGPCNFLHVGNDKCVFPVREKIRESFHMRQKLQGHFLLLLWSWSLIPDPLRSLEYSKYWVSLSTPMSQLLSGDPRSSGFKIENCVTLECLCYSNKSKGKLNKDQPKEKDSSIKSIKVSINANKYC